MKVKLLNELASEMVGDGKKPNVFFVTEKGDVITVTQSFEKAYSEWRILAQNHIESALEDRQTGILASAGMEPQYSENTGDFTGPLAWDVRDDATIV